MKTLAVIREKFPESIWCEDFAEATITRTYQTLEWDNQLFYIEGRVKYFDEPTANLLSSLNFERTEIVPTTKGTKKEILYFAKNETNCFLFIVSEESEPIIQEDNYLLYYLCDSSTEDYYNYKKNSTTILKNHELYR